jgi:hypothetical protein
LVAAPWSLGWALVAHRLVVSYSLVIVRFLALLQLAARPARRPFGLAAGDSPPDYGGLDHFAVARAG